jgi:DNA-binding beta-propeller fold protein YncE
MVKWLSLAAAFALAACAQETPSDAPAAVRLEQVWRVGGFANPESVALSSDGTFLYVTNVNGEGEAQDGNGFISRVSLDGEMLQREFATGLDGPKGIMAAGDALYVADIDELVVLDATTGAIRRRVPAAGAQFLNDLAFAPDGQVLMADSATRRIYGVRSDTAEVWLEHELLDSINGLLPETDRLIVTTMAGRLLAIDYETHAVTVLAEGLGNADGVAAIGEERYLVSEWPGLMHVVNTEYGSHQTIMDTQSEERFLNDFLLVGEILYQPHWEPSELTAYRVVR